MRQISGKQLFLAVGWAVSCYLLCGSHGSFDTRPACFWVSQFRGHLLPAAQRAKVNSQSYCATVKKKWCHFQQLFLVGDSSQHLYPHYLQGRAAQGSRTQTLGWTDGVVVIMIKQEAVQVTGPTTGN